MHRGRKSRARPFVAGFSLAAAVAIAIGRLWRKGRVTERSTSMIETNKSVARRVVDELFNAGRLESANELIAPGYTGYDPASPGPIKGVDGIKQQVGGYRAAFPDMRITIDEQFAEGDLVATRWTARGTHEGELFGIPATGKQATVSGITIDRVVDGRLEESWNNWDTLGLLQQLGAVPALAEA